MSTTTAHSIRTAAHIPFSAAERFGDAPAQRVKQDGIWHDVSYREFADQVGRLATRLVEVGIAPGDRVGILAETRAEWSLAQFGVLAAGAVVVPIYPSNSPEECEWVLRDSGSVAVVCENADQVAKVAGVREALPDLRQILVIEPDGEHPTLAELAGQADPEDRTELVRRLDAVGPDQPAVIIYTSGTTGKPKGCVLTHSNLMGCVAEALREGLTGPDDVCYLFLPLAHVFAQVLNIDTMATGGTVAFVSDGPTSIMSDLAEVRPTVFPSVPRIFEKVHGLLANQPANGEVFAKARALFGGRIRIAISGAAPIAPEILEFFHTAGVPVYEGYGLSESTATGTLNLPQATKLGTIGRPLSTCEVRCAEDGELLLRAPYVFAGYWNNPEATREALTEDGWLKTGDLGAIDEEGYVRITGRKKEIIITAGGKNLTPSEFENAIRQAPLVSYAVMHGDRRPYPVALITLDADYAVPWAEAQGLPTDLPALASHPRVRQELQQAVDEVNAKHAKVAQVKRFAVLSHDFTQQTGELTPTLKMRRAVIEQMYTDVLEGLYSQPR